MKCNPCARENQKKFRTETAIHLPGREGLNQSAVFVFVEISICAKCGKAEFTIPESELRLLNGDVATTAA